MKVEVPTIYEVRSIYQTPTVTGIVLHGDERVVNNGDVPEKCEIQCGEGLILS